MLTFLVQEIRSDYSYKTHLFFTFSSPQLFKLHPVWLGETQDRAVNVFGAASSSFATLMNRITPVSLPLGFCRSVLRLLQPRGNPRFTILREKELMRVILCAAAAMLCLAGQAMGQVRITEWMYNESEFVELTNLGPGSVNFAGWSFDDDSRTPGVFSLSGFGIVAAGETVVFSEVSATDFRTEWNLPLTVKVLGGNAANLGRNDEINIYNGTTLVDRLTFGDQTFPGTIRTVGISGNAPFAALGDNTVADWELASVGDRFGSYASAGGWLGNPGTYAVPEPTSVALAMISLAALGFVRR